MNIDWNKVLKIGAGVAAVGAAGYGVGKWAAQRQANNQSYYAEDDYEDDYEEDYDEEEEYEQDYEDNECDNNGVVYIKGIPYIEDEYGNYVPYEEEEEEVVYINGFPYVMDENGNYVPNY